MTSLSERNLRIVDKYFANEGEHDIPEVLCGYTPDVKWRAPNRGIALEGLEAVGSNYQKIFGSLQNVVFRTVNRCANDTSVMDHSIVTCFYVGGLENFPAPPESYIQMDLYHYFEITPEGLISLEVAGEFPRVVYPR